MTLFAKLATAAALLVAASGSALAASPAPGSLFDYVAADDSYVYTEVFYGGERAHICIEGDGRSDIDLWVYDENANLIAKSTSYGAYECVSFVPAWTGPFDIEVENHGKPRGSDFELITN
jgi:hypothetical protein